MKVPLLPDHSPYQAIYASLVTGDQEGFDHLWAAHRAAGERPEIEPSLLWMATRLDDRKALACFWPTLPPFQKHQAAATAIEYGRPELLAWMGQQTILDMSQVMYCAAMRDMSRTVQKLLKAGVPLYNEDTTRSSVAVAAENNNTAVLALFLPQLNTPASVQVVNHAIAKAGRTGGHEAVGQLWSLASISGQISTLQEAAMIGDLDLIRCMTENWAPPADQDTRQGIAKLLVCLLNPRYELTPEHHEVFTCLLPWADANHGQADALRQALARDAKALIPSLLKTSDPELAKRILTKKRPVPWDLVVRLGQHVDPDRRAAWLRADKAGHLGELLAHDRSERAKALRLNEPSTRSRKPRSRC